MTPKTESLSRYAKHILLRNIGVEGQNKLGRKAVVLIGCGGLGCATANHLVRAGVGRVKIIDGDRVDLGNIQRQMLFDEKDAERNIPKAIAAASKLRNINSSVEVAAEVVEIYPGNIEELTEGADLIIDGTDNLEIRLLINEVSIKNGIPWIYGAAAGTVGMTMNIIPGTTPCFRCITAGLSTPKPAFRSAEVGILNTLPALVASIQTTEAMKILLDDKDINRDLLYLDLWSGCFLPIKISIRPECPLCAEGEYQYLK